MKSGSKKFWVAFGSSSDWVLFAFGSHSGWIRIEFGSSLGWVWVGVRLGLGQVRYISTQLHHYFKRLNTARSFVRSLQTSSNPISTGNGDESESIKLSAQVLGLGPVFKLVIGLCNTSTSTPSRYLLITFYCDDKMYRYEIYRLHQKNLQSSGIISYVF